MNTANDREIFISFTWRLENTKIDSLNDSRRDWVTHENDTSVVVATQLMNHFVSPMNVVV